ncbi:hypothetical protein P4O66_022815 [Electrophorus voltai]|uniref:IF rod domain-containing protein n=1 Tax=Electrophorus voltai TaxID=2609070 RepID=A0AAD8ZPD9_9TELE|nr:hypothetical protein P4O66_022815 [Electrophorus voltai]
MNRQYKGFTHSTRSDVLCGYSFSTQSVGSLPHSLKMLPYSTCPDGHYGQAFSNRSVGSLSGCFGRDKPWQAVPYMSMVRHLVQQNKMLETKWQLLQDETQAASPLEPIMKSYITNLQAQLHSLERNKDHCDSELQSALMLVEVSKRRSDIQNKMQTCTNLVQCWQAFCPRL